ncbi:37S ribosomal protein S16, mitochondrial [Dispira simplex]|nr:37S ribosomal protein S16, mitochondrial [Dispira simplex]
MVVRIRFALHGTKRQRVFHIVAANCRTRRNSKPLEMLGKYNPLPDATGTKHVELNLERTKYWLSVGAQPSDPARKLLEKAGLLPPKPAPWRDMGSVTPEQSIASLSNNKATAPSSNISSASVTV